jgi:hypothetical protein
MLKIIHNREQLPRITTHSHPINVVNGSIKTYKERLRKEKSLRN